MRRPDGASILVLALADFAPIGGDNQHKSCGANQRYDALISACVALNIGGTDSNSNALQPPRNYELSPPFDGDKPAKSGGNDDKCGPGFFKDAILGCIRENPFSGHGVRRSALLPR